MRVLVTGGCGFIGSALVRYLVAEVGAEVWNIDVLTYAGSVDNVASIASAPTYHFVQGSITDRALVEQTFSDAQPDIVMHLAAESHVDRSISGPSAFIDTNIVGTSVMLEAARQYWEKRSDTAQQRFCFHHISTDEVYGSLGETGLFHETTAYDPSSPYSASKAASDHLVRAWHRTYQLPVVITNCSNNYGPFQYPEKLIPVVIRNALNRDSIPVYGQGTNVRDWLYVDDHVQALWLAATKGQLGHTYNVGGDCEKTNITLVQMICDLLDEIHPSNNGSCHELITFVEDRKGHDLRYAIDASKIKQELGWQPTTSIDDGLRTTVAWYIRKYTA